jgi:excisionase family DNA binding protein
VKSYTLKEAAALLGLSPDTLRSQIRYGALTGRKVGNAWTVTAKAIERYRAEHRRA